MQDLGCCAKLQPAIDRSGVDLTKIGRVLQIVTLIEIDEIDRLTIVPTAHRLAREKYNVCTAMVGPLIGIFRHAAAKL